MSDYQHIPRLACTKHKQRATQEKGKHEPDPASLSPGEGELFPSLYPKEETKQTG